MKRASDMFSDADRKRVNEVVSAAEAKTSAEFVPMVATASGRYDRPEDIAGLWLGGAAMLAAWALVPTASEELGAWGGAPAWAQPLAMVVALLAGFCLGAVIAGKAGWLRRLFTPARQMAEEVDAAARVAFFDHRVHHTEGATGVLIYISLFERRAAVIADKNVIDALREDGEEDTKVLDRLCGQVTDRIKSSGLAAAIAETIADVAARISGALPRSSSDVNELPDALVTID